MKAGKLMAKVVLRKINKMYENKYYGAKDINLEIEDGDFVVLVGPSGCGKSTTLRMIAGLEEISSGELYIGDRLVNNVEPFERDVAMVFQNYALYPHFSVFENMAFALKIKKIKKDEIKNKIQEAAKILELEKLLDRKPKELSGGQRQRVALGRAMVREPEVFLMDEPLSNLDAKLRVSMRSEIIKLHKRLKSTFIYVTHDQTEAMTMGNKIVVMNNGEIQQAADPITIYKNPRNKFVASFIGSPQMNFFNVKVIEEGKKIYIVNDFLKYEIRDNVIRKILEEDYLNYIVEVGLRPEFIKLEMTNNISTFNKSKSIVKGKIELLEILGAETLVHFSIKGKKMICKTEGIFVGSEGDEIYLNFNLKECHLFDKETEMRIDYFDDDFKEKSNDEIREKDNTYYRENDYFENMVN